MGKYSSDSDYEKRSGKKHKSSGRRRSSSSDSSETRLRRRKKIYSDTHRSKSKSRDRYSKSRRSRSESRHRSQKLKHRRSTSRDKSRNRRSKSRDCYRRSRSHDKHKSHRSRSRSYIREFVSKPKRRGSSSSSSSSRSSSSIEHRAKQKLNNSIGSNGKRALEQSSEMPTVDSKILEDINSENFVPKQYSSANKKVPENIVINLKKQTIKVPEVEASEPDSIFHHNLFQNEEARMEKWVRELYTYRQKALQQGLKRTE